ncbi:MAG: hypothetical protein OHK93_008536 [Ramalina farinacea]|uniref:Heterokaryon incompatibility domain-containing protein n=1 Tax=Ramalina farinacea TaxID=258253 RepID=A0AA43TV67_9LECA|nr:hypothetical protein [Ramalina farinacea]
MGDIYSWAEEVIVWLGMPDDETALVWRILLELGKLCQFEPHEVFDLALGSPLTGKDAEMVVQTPPNALESTRGALKARVKLPPGSSPEWKAVKRFFERPWFSRTWTFQEVLLSQSCTIICGKRSLSWTDPSDAVHAIDIVGFDKHMYATHKGIVEIQVGRKRLRNGQSTALWLLLQNTRYRSATEPRDKIYAVRAAVRDSVAENIVVDYGETLGETYARAVKSCIEESKALTVLGSVEYRRTEESKLQMPSWVPDWRYKTSVAVELSMRRRDGSKYFDACNGKKPLITRESDPRKLRLKGVIVARLKRFSEVKRWLDFDLDLRRARRFPTDRFQLDQWQALYRSAVGNVKFPISSLKAPEQADEIMASIWASRFSPSGTHGGLTEHDEYVADTMLNREFFIADNGADAFMGIVMGAPADGDCVCILFGGDTPFVLRPKDNGEWHFIAEAYVHGIMDGEALAHQDRQSFAVEEFILS